jgi:hypothetical protein
MIATIHRKKHPGAKLFLYAMGGGHLPINIFLQPAITFGSIEGITIPTGYYALKNPTAQGPS